MDADHVVEELVLQTENDRIKSMCLLLYGFFLPWGQILVKKKKKKEEKTPNFPASEVKFACRFS